MNNTRKSVPNLLEGLYDAFREIYLIPSGRQSEEVLLLWLFQLITLIVAFFVAFVVVAGPLAMTIMIVGSLIMSRVITDDGGIAIFNISGFIGRPLNYIILQASTGLFLGLVIRLLLF